MVRGALKRDGKFKQFRFFCFLINGHADFLFSKHLFLYLGQILQAYIYHIIHWTLNFSLCILCTEKYFYCLNNFFMVEFKIFEKSMPDQSRS